MPNRKLQERLAGAVVLALLAVVFLPMILDDEGGGGSGITHTNIPPPPLPAPDPRPGLPTTPEAPPPSHAAANAPQERAGQTAWVVQTGSFSQRENAEELSKKLRANDYQSFVQPARTETGQTLYKVRIGPELQRKDAERIKKNLQQTMSLEGIIVAYP